MGRAATPELVSTREARGGYSDRSTRKLYGSPEISGRECVFLSGPRFDSRHKLWIGRSRSPGDRAERADQAGVGGEPVPRHLAGVHDVGEAPKYRVGEPVAAQIVPNPLDWIELRAVGRQR